MTKTKDNFFLDDKGSEMYNLISELFPICRSITGNGVRQTLDIIGKHIPLQITEVPTGTPIFDWEIPNEWNINDAYILNDKGEKIVDFKKLNLHVLNYSAPIDAEVSLNELKPHLFSDPDKPELVPYRTSYFQENWGFCISDNQKNKLKEGNYKVKIDSSLEPGSLTYGEYLVKGKSDEEVLVSTHICHPSLCNDNLSGIAVATFLAKFLETQQLKYSYRFLFIPGTIGSIAWLSKNQENTKKIKHGLVITLLGDNSNYTFKKSRDGGNTIDKAVIHFLNTSYPDSNIIDFFPYGYDERQYCSPGFNLPVGCLTRKPHGEFREYHTSGDNLDFVNAKKLNESAQTLKSIFFILENNTTYVNQNPFCEPLLGRRGLYDRIGGTNESKILQLASLWVLNQSDGKNSLLDIAVKSEINFDLIHKSALALEECDLLKKVL